jgi:nitrilase
MKNPRDRVTALRLRNLRRFYNKAASLTSARELLRDAASPGAMLIPFGETWIPGCPVWLDICPSAALWNHQPTKVAFIELRENRTSINRPEVATSNCRPRVSDQNCHRINERVDERQG